jgi:hypothetical protein
MAITGNMQARTTARVGALRVGAFRVGYAPKNTIGVQPTWTKKYPQTVTWTLVEP